MFAVMDVVYKCRCGQEIREDDITTQLIQSGNVIQVDITITCRSCQNKKFRIIDIGDFLEMK